MISDNVRVLKALGEPTRLRMVKLLSHQELCVCELVAVLDMSQPRVSQHLRVLKNAGIVEERRDRQRRFYRLKDGFGSGEVSCFTRYMASAPEQLPELALEYGRMADLDHNEAVARCKGSG